MTTENKKVASIAKEIKLAEEALEEWKSKDEPLSPTMINQYQLLKEELLKDLLVELVRSGVSFKSAGDFIQRLTTYLQKADNEQPLSNSLRKNLSAIEKTLAA